MKVIEIKADKEYIDYINRLLQDINFDDDSLKMQKLIKELNARQDDNINLFSVLRMFYIKSVKTSIRI